MLHLAYFADDFTGATDALDALALAGLRTRLFLNPPTPEQCAGLDAVGVAGLTRSLAPEPMAAVLRPAFTALRALGPRHVYYKVCSTFDSSPTVGSIGRAIEVGREVFGGDFVPILAAAPALGRYCAFGNLFARYGIGRDGPIYRLDRHPAISQHPVTPMTEAYLPGHLFKQVELVIGLVNLAALEQGETATAASLRENLQGGAEIVFFDSLNESHLRTVGFVLDRHAAQDRPLFSVGSSSLGTALASVCRAESPNPAPSALPPSHHAGFDDPAGQGPLLALSGSCSPVTAGQIDHALARGFTGVALDPAAPDTAAARGEIITALRAGRSVIAYTARGAAGPAPAPAGELGAALGRLACEAVAATGLRRVVFAGGDTSSYAARALGLASVEMLAPLAPGVPWCRAHAPGSPADGLAVSFKGGQAGALDFFPAAAHS